MLNDSKQLGVRVAPALFEELTAAAVRRGVPISHLVREAIENELQTEAAVMRHLALQERMIQARIRLRGMTREEAIKDLQDA